MYIVVDISWELAAVKGIRVMGGVAPHIPNFGSFTPWALYPQKKGIGIHWIECCIGPISGLNAF